LTLMLYYSPFLSLLPWVPWCSSTIAHMFHMSLYMIIFVFCICLFLDLSSAYERKYMDLIFLNLAYFIWHDVFQWHPFMSKPHGGILPYGWIKLHFIYTYIYIYVHICIYTHIIYIHTSLYIYKYISYIYTFFSWSIHQM
jgi:hypothetical protein